MDIVIIGGGIAAANAARQLRDSGHEGGILVLAAERHLPYERPPLSKGILLGDATPESTHVLEQHWYDEHDVDLRTGTAVTSIDLDRRQVHAGAESAPYDRLLIATGATPRRLVDLDDSDLPVAYLRTVDDSVALKEAFLGQLLIVGAGWIGLEVAAAARLAGMDVTVVDPAEQPLLAVLGPDLGARFAELHRGHGVDLRLSTSVDTVEGRTVRLSDGHELSPDLVLVGIGAVPDDRLAREAGLAVDNGILVDPTLRTSDPYVFAVGDVANHQHPVLGRRIRVEHWDTAQHQGRAAALAMLGDDEPYTRMPYFFTDQYDMGMEYVGSVGPGGADEVVVRGDDLVAGLTALWAQDGTVVAGMQSNDWDATDTIRALVGRPVPVGFADPAVPLGDLVDREGAAAGDA
jgi:3-phenylpropionate/trans-cinnamate dioxygenase ferredoxin reductase component